MPRGLTATDRRLLSWSAVLLVILVAAVVFTTPTGGQEGSPVPSVYSPTPRGARAAYLLLQDLGFDVRVWEEPPELLSSVTAHALLILAEPTDAPTNGDRTALLHFVEHGGRVLFCGAVIPAYFSSATVSPPVSSSTPYILTADLPSTISRGADHISMRPQSWWGQIGPSQLRLYGTGRNAAIVSWRIGGGEVLWWSSASPLTNEGLRQSGNLTLLLNSVSTSLRGPGPIYWDEYFHGQRTSLLGYFEKTPLTWGVWQIGLVAILVIFSFSRRSGPIVMPPAVSRLSPLEFIDTMGALYRHADAFVIPVEVSYRHLRLELTQRLGLPPATADADLARIAADRLGADGPDLADALASSAAATTAGRLTSRNALALLQRLESLLARITAPASFFKEKN
ncbi:MAG TPA: DUF4350 domain-containing protein [Bryobacteraceae bacterium]|nr:DUF4350 domain-containing protein [Bryobacteraceae bacterium]